MLSFCLREWPPSSSNFQLFVKNPTLSLFTLGNAFAADTHLFPNILRESCGVSWWKGLFTQSSVSLTRKEKWVKGTFKKKKKQLSPKESTERRVLRQKRQSKLEVIIRNHVEQSFISLSKNKCMFFSLLDYFRERTVAQQTKLAFAQWSLSH